MSSGDHDREPAGAQSFSVSEAVRARIGSRVGEREAVLVRSAGLRLLVGLALVLFDLRLEAGIDVAPDVLGALVILAGAASVATLATAVGPTRAGGRVVALAVLHLVLAWPNDVPVSWLAPLGLTEAGWEVVAAAQTVAGLLGTAVAATVLARAHDALDQLGRRDRWARVRRVSLVLVLAWLPFAALTVAVDEAAGVVRLLVGLTSVVTLALGLALLVLLARALAGSIAVASRMGHGER